MGKLLKFLAGERTKRAELAGAVMLVAGRPQNRGGETGQNAEAGRRGRTRPNERRWRMMRPNRHSSSKR